MVTDLETPAGHASAPPTASADPRHAPARRALSRWLRVAGLASLIVPIAIVAGSRGGWGDQALGSATLVLGSIIPTLVHAASAALLVGIALVIAAPAVGSWPRSRGWTIAMRVVSMLAIALTLLLALGAWVEIAFRQPSYAPVGAPSTSGCRVVVASTSLGFHHRTTDVGVVQPGATRVEWLVRDVTTDVGTFGASAQVGVAWDGDDGVLVVEDGPSRIPTIVTATIDGVAVSCDAS